MSNVVPQTGQVAASEPAVVVAPPFEKQLAADFNSAMSEASLYFEGSGKVYESLNRILQRLDQLQVDYAICGGMALFAHGFRRFTDDVDLLVTAEGLNLIHERLEGLGYVRPFLQSKHLRDVVSGVRIEFLVAGQFPGDGKPKDVAFPTPASASEVLDGRRVLTLPKLIELKLASGMTGANRGKDFMDVSALIESLKLPLEFENQLNPYVQAKYRSLWQSVASIKYVLGLPRETSQLPDATLSDFLRTTTANRSEVDALLAAGLVFDAELSRPEYSILSTTDATVAERFEMVPQHDFIYLPRTNVPTTKE